jgi:REP element-mobilizing transposase RayT
MKQMKLNLYGGKHGGRRPGSGRKRIHSPGVSHLTRERISLRTPMHINFKYRAQIQNKVSLKILKKAILNARSHGLRINHFSLQSNHIHLIIEAETNEILSRGMRSLTVTFAKGLKKGRVQLGRYHLHVLRCLRETKNAVQYVLFNQQKHENGACSRINEYSSVFGLKDAIKKFARKEKMMLKVERGERMELDTPQSFLLHKTMKLISDY